MGHRHAPLAERFAEAVMPVTECGCWLWLGPCQQDGYGIIRDGRTRTAHRVSWELHRGPIPVGRCVLHKCDVRSCVNPDHLFLGSLRDNAIDMARKRRAGGQRLGPDEAARIRQDARPLAAICAEYGISPAQASRIRNGRRFNYV